MRKAKLLSTVAMALLLNAGVAAAQATGKDTPEQPPAAQQNVPAEKVAPTMRQGGNGSSQTTGQTAPDSKTGKAHETTGQSPNPGAGGRPDAKPDTTDKGKSGAASGKSEPRSKMEQSGGSSKSSQGATEQNHSTTTGQGAAGSARLSTEQRTKVTSIIRQNKVESTKLNISVTVGARVPASVHLYPLPVQVIEVYPAWRGFNYVLVGNQIVIINPRTHEIVAILET